MLQTTTSEPAKNTKTVSLENTSELTALGRKIGTGAVCFAKTTGCPVCPEQESIIETLNAENENKVVMLMIDANEINKKVSKSLDLDIVPSFLFFKDGDVLMAKDVDTRGDFLLPGFKNKASLERIFEIINSQPAGLVFDIMLRRHCIACRLNKICLLHKLSKKRASCGLFWRASKFNIYQ